MIGLRFAVQCGLCTSWFHGDCIELSPTAAKTLNYVNMEWLCIDCSTVGGLGKQYLLEQRLDLAMQYCKKLDDHSIYADVIKSGRVG